MCKLAIWFWGGGYLLILGVMQKYMYLMNWEFLGAYLLLELGIYVGTYQALNQ
jgi:hypothetical protein